VARLSLVHSFVARLPAVPFPRCRATRRRLGATLRAMPVVSRCRCRMCMRASTRHLPFFVSSPCARRQCCVAAMATPPPFYTHAHVHPRGGAPVFSIQPVRALMPSFHSRTRDPHRHHARAYAAEPHLAPPCRRCKPQCAGTRVSVEPSNARPSLLGRLDPKHHLALARSPSCPLFPWLLCGHRDACP
jgi:hypothetical protein